MPAKTNEPGLFEEFTIDGLTYAIPKDYQPSNPLAQAVFESLAGTATIKGTYRGDGLPDRADSFTWQIPYDIDATNGLLADQVEVLRATPGPHFFADWKQRVAFYSLRAGQSYLYLPREDASQKGWPTSEPPDPAQFTPGWTGTAQTVIYKPDVVAPDAPAANEIWVATTPIRHPDSGRWCAPFKLGSPPVVPSTLLVRFYPVFRVDVLGVTTSFAQRHGREDKVLILGEVN